jgi:hypothetical protein
MLICIQLLINDKFKMRFTTALSVAGLVAVVSAADIPVDVGKGGSFQFSPVAVNATKGDRLVFTVCLLLLAVSFRSKHLARTMPPRIALLKAPSLIPARSRPTERIPASSRSRTMPTPSRTSLLVVDLSRQCMVAHLARSLPLRMTPRRYGSSVALIAHQRAWYSLCVFHIAF